MFNICVFNSYQFLNSRLLLSDNLLCRSSLSRRDCVTSFSAIAKGEEEEVLLNEKRPCKNDLPSCFRNLIHHQAATTIARIMTENAIANDEGTSKEADLFAIALFPLLEDVGDAVAVDEEDKLGKGDGDGDGE